MNVNEAVVTTYAGWVSGVSVIQAQQMASADTMKSVVSEENQMKIEMLR